MYTFKTLEELHTYIEEGRLALKSFPNMKSVPIPAAIGVNFTNGSAIALFLEGACKDNDINNIELDLLKEGAGYTVYISAMLSDEDKEEALLNQAKHLEELSKSGGKDLIKLMRDLDKLIGNAGLDKLTDDLNLDGDIDVS